MPLWVTCYIIHNYKTWVFCWVYTCQGGPWILCIYYSVCSLLELSLWPLWVLHLFLRKNSLLVMIEEDFFHHFLFCRPLKSLIILSYCFAVLCKLYWAQILNSLVSMAVCMVNCLHSMLPSDLACGSCSLYGCRCEGEACASHGSHIDLLPWWCKKMHLSDVPSLLWFQKKASVLSWVWKWRGIND